MLKLDTPFEHIMIVENSRDDSAIHKNLIRHKKSIDKRSPPLFGSFLLCQRGGI